jgi:hypothetical protein
MLVGFEVDLLVVLLLDLLVEWLVECEVDVEWLVECEVEVEWLVECEVEVEWLVEWADELVLLPGGGGGGGVLEDPGGAGGDGGGGGGGGPAGEGTGDARTAGMANRLSARTERMEGMAMARSSACWNEKRMRYARRVREEWFARRDL